ncbi:MAG: putative ABC transporter permease [Sarcina sp.]
MENIFKYIAYFFIYSFLGWCCEVVYCSDFSKREFINRGMLRGPICPIYGVGACILIFFIYKFKKNFLLVFILGMIIASIVEYIASFILEKIFNTRWWHYETYAFNLNGRICLLNSILFGILSIILIRYIHTEISELTEKLSDNIFYSVLLISIIIFFVDIVKTIKNIKFLTSDICDIRCLNIELKKYNLNLKEVLLDDKYEFNRGKVFIKEKIIKLKNRKKEVKRLLKAFPRIKYKNFSEEINNLRGIFKNNNGKR